MATIPRGYRYDEKTKTLVKKATKPPSVSEKLRRKSSKKVRVPKQTRTP